jgi:hypothetical protein
LEEQKKTIMGYHIKRTYRCCGKNELVERATRPQQPALKAVSRRRLLILVSIRVRLKDGHQRKAGKVVDPRVTFLGF